MDGSTTRPGELATAFRAAGTGVAAPESGPLVAAAVTAGLGIDPGVLGCSLTEFDGTSYRTPVYAGEASMALDLVQYETGRGPCLAAAREQRSYLADDPGALSRSLPGWAAVAARWGVGAVLSLPLTGTEQPASLNFYGSAAARFRPPVVPARAAVLSRLVGALLSSRPDGSPSPSRADDPGQDAVSRQRGLLAQAVAALARAGDITEAGAFIILARRSADEQRGIAAVAADVLADAGQRGEDR